VHGNLEGAALHRLPGTDELAIHHYAPEGGGRQETFGCGEEVIAVRHTSDDGGIIGFTKQWVADHRTGTCIPSFEVSAEVIGVFQHSHFALASSVHGQTGALGWHTQDLV